MTTRAARALPALLAAMLAAPGSLSTAAALPAGDDGPRVVAVEIEGAKRTRRETVLLLARVREGTPWRAELAEQVRQELANTNLFYEVSVTPEPVAGGVRLHIALREKWTLIAVPLVTVRDDETTWGGTVIESNLLGTASTLIVTLAVRDGEPGGRLLYVDPHLRGSRFQLFGTLTYLEETKGVWDADAETGSYRQRTAGGTFALGYRFARRTSAAVGLRAADFSFDDPEGGAAPPADARERALLLTLRHAGTDLDEERRRGLSGELRLEFGVAALGDEVGRTAASGVARWARTFAGGRTLDVAGYGLWTDTVDYGESARTPTSFLRGYDADRFRPDRLLGGSVECQVPVARLREATLSVVPFADAALLRDATHDFAADDAPVDAGLALSVHVRRVALPVLQVYGAYGFATEETLFGFALGASF